MMMLLGAFLTADPPPPPRAESLARDEEDEDGAPDKTRPDEPLSALPGESRGPDRSQRRCRAWLSPKASSTNAR
jgi:hypothetical protein